MIPAEVGIDRRLKYRDVLVYFVLAGHRRGGTVSVGSRRVGAFIGAGKTMVAESLLRLADTGHIEIMPRDRGKRPVYRLTSALFAEEARQQGRHGGGKSRRSTTVSAALDWARVQEQRAQEIA